MPTAFAVRERVPSLRKELLRDAAQTRLVERLFDLREAVVHRLPTGGDEVDEQRQVVDARMPLGEQIAFEPFEAPQHLVHETARLGEVAGTRTEMLLQPLLDRAGQPF